MQKDSKVLCFECGVMEAVIVKDPRYNGLRGRCAKCMGDWPES